MSTIRFQKNHKNYYVGGRGIGKCHIDLSVVATDVGGGFSIGLDGRGFTIGLSGSWLLFTGLIGAWVAALVLVPKVWKLAKTKKLLTSPQLFEHYNNELEALAAGIISAIGYIGLFIPVFGA